MGRLPKLWQYDSLHQKNWSTKKVRQRYALATAESFEQLPQYEAMRHGITYRWGTYNDFPIEQYLNARVGDCYDDIFSDMLKRIPKKLLHLSKIYERWAIPRTYHPEGDGIHRFNGTDLFVDLATNILHRVEDGTFFKPFEQDIFELKIGGRNFVVRQLASAQDFKEEGRVMSHCVSTYRRYCRRPENETSIWSLGCKVSAELVERNLTIEVRGKNISQVRGYKNRVATKKEREVVRAWAKMVDLKVQDFAF